MKPCVERWLGQRRLARFVLAYATAHPVDGGGGAVYVLLKPDR
jgi:DNA-nicking Smr family endonuclease